jgi:hypothetical protein
MQFCVDVHLLIEPKLLDGCGGVCQAVGLNYDVSDCCIVDDVFHCCDEVVSSWVGEYLALQQMQPLGSSKKLLKGVPL